MNWLDGYTGVHFLMKCYDLTEKSYFLYFCIWSNIFTIKIKAVSRNSDKCVGTYLRIWQILLGNFCYESRKQSPITFINLFNKYLLGSFVCSAMDIHVVKHGAKFLMSQKLPPSGKYRCNKPFQPLEHQERWRTGCRVSQGYDTETGGHGKTPLGSRVKAESAVGIELSQ